MLQFLHELAFPELNSNHSHSFAYDGEYLYFTTDRNQIRKADKAGNWLEDINVRRRYDSICYDKDQNVFWAVCSYNPDIIFQLTEEFRERSYIQMYAGNWRIGIIQQISYCDITEEFVLISSNHLYQGDKQGNVWVSPESDGIRHAVVSACMGQEWFYCITESDEGFLLRIFSREDGREAEQISLPRYFRISSIQLEETEDENEYQINLLGNRDDSLVGMISYRFLSKQQEAKASTEELKREEDVIAEAVSEVHLAEAEKLETVEALAANLTGILSSLEDSAFLEYRSDQAYDSATRHNCRRHNPCEHMNCGNGNCGNGNCEMQNGCNCRDCRCKPPQRCCHCLCIDILETVACMEASLAHILNAEGEKIQMGVKKARNVRELIEVNDSARDTVIHACHLEQVLYAKMEAALRMCKKECTCKKE